MATTYDDVALRRVILLIRNSRCEIHSQLCDLEDQRRQLDQQHERLAVEEFVLNWNDAAEA